MHDNNTYEITVYFDNEDAAVNLIERWGNVLVGNEDYIHNNIIISQLKEEQLAVSGNTHVARLTVFHESKTDIIFDSRTKMISIAEE